MLALIIKRHSQTIYRSFRAVRRTCGCGISIGKSEMRNAIQEVGKKHVALGPTREQKSGFEK